MYKTLRTCNYVETPSVKNQTLEGVLKQIMCSYYTTGVIDGTWAMKIGRKKYEGGLLYLRKICITSKMYQNGRGEGV